MSDQPNQPNPPCPNGSDPGVPAPPGSLDHELLCEAAAEEQHRRSLVLLPNALTTAAMFCGFFAIMQAFNGHFVMAAWAIVVAGIFDGLDGRVARLVKGTSAFGEQYDSLSDLIAFGFAPACISYFWALKDFGRLGWAVAFVYLACAAIRLAKFNTLTAEAESKRYFRGIPSPAAAGLIIIQVLMHAELNPELYENGGGTPGGLLVRGGMLIWTVTLSLLMVSNLRFRTFKDVHFTKYGPMVPLVGVAAILAVFMVRPEITLYLVGASYLSIGLIEGTIIRRREKELRIEQRRLRREMRIKRKLERQKARQAKKEAKEKKRSGLA